MKKKGELTTQQIVMLVILVTSFAVILFFLFRLNLGKETDQEICHNSVVMRGNSVLPKDAVSLNCKTNYVCITEDGTCEGLIKPEVKKVETENEVYEVLANEMVDCWWIFGEGKVDYVGGDFKHNNYCSICSQILFDDSLKNLKEVKDGKISKDELYDYLGKTNMNGKEITYSEYLFDTKNIKGIKQEFFEKQGVDTFGNIEIGKQYFVVMGITSNVGYGWKIAQATGVVVGVASFFTPAGWITGVVFTAGAIVTGGSAVGEQIAVSNEPEILALTMDGKGIDNQFMLPTILEVDSEKFKQLNCEEILTFQ